MRSRWTTDLHPTLSPPATRREKRSNGGEANVEDGIITGSLPAEWRADRSPSPGHEKVLRCQRCGRQLDSALHDEGFLQGSQREGSTDQVPPERNPQPTSVRAMLLSNAAETACPTPHTPKPQHASPRKTFALIGRALLCFFLPLLCTESRSTTLPSPGNAFATLAMSIPTSASMCPLEPPKIPTALSRSPRLMTDTVTALSLACCAASLAEWGRQDTSASAQRQ